ncbi:bifunctional 4-hydroxy-3-methylbut-2-enyl diphosphate reductase/30S ribosomal protein S1 [Butyricicoccus faecihominis]|uniref:bifunctional 4-hydroxy-3-methylbut-2-enyl diphosphate reductase/30S ribosomal protein S1 n=1 Tax=Butyricicoccaceae TaxID=3085642 RepID=UPI0024784038|nr:MULTISPECIES: bifunctional 4-hydroxy-3-methylbut-2-enyl diphosphate reductase/30S ribosomal protein S1 [Butyricicoccaceae]MCQ5128535.1 bifunctional 4-hydroxy-3-methylbut-2-enyl diphosphate reductase/30S ribosomal protein S1 [Butyricicoccus faecihominis]WNX83373.1 bifunctional 4-hydroxy-3-methylbut-2-enyl diphosphate reductase/30S ribosomal protein S1 [Agathobaculum sp. NTUH-O15-33]
MSVTVAKTAGFCFGVRRAVELAEAEAEKRGRIYAYGEIIHNQHEIDRLTEKGVQTAGEIALIPDGAPVLIRAHGVPRAALRQLAEKRCEIFDATCPFVHKIHKIADEQSADGRLVVIFGSPGHPEVVGIQGWCGESVVLASETETARAVEDPAFCRRPISVVAQTTVNRTLWNKSIGLLKKRCTNLKIFDTICKATDERQSEARLLAGASDEMIVIGDKKSSNTKRLYEISRSLCGNVLLIEDAEELQAQERGHGRRVGITAGASTPAWIIKEVSNMMSEETKIENGEDFAAMLEESFKTLNTGEKVTGTVVAISSTDVQVDLGVKHTAYIPLSELSDDPSYDVNANIHPGDEIEAVVVRVNDGEGTVTLSKKRVDQLKGWETIEKAFEDHAVVEGIIVEENRGGVVATAFGVRVFVPASQTGVPKDQPMSQLVKTKQSFYITEINRQRKRVVGSIRQIQQEARKVAAEKIWETIEVGNEYDGTVKSLTSYGAFVDIGGVDGMVHISELSWGRIKHPSEVVAVGDQIKVFVIGLDKENKKISLGYKREEDNPWNVFKSNYAVGDVAEVKILKFMPFGAFAEIVPGVDGLIHISQIADHRIAKPEDALTAGQQVDAKIIDINDEKKKVSLSIRALLVDDDEYDDE